jgi:uncharacterized protein (TIGR02452 family)
MFIFQPCIDSNEIAKKRQSELSIPRAFASTLGASAVISAREGRYFIGNGESVDWKKEVDHAIASKVSIPPDQALPQKKLAKYDRTTIQVTNETTILAARRLVNKGERPLALNFANGIQPGGGFLSGALAQEECLCRSSALYVTLENDPMYEHQRHRPLPDSTDWAIYSPDVPVFRADDGRAFKKPWLLSFLSCAAPVATRMDRKTASILLARRIERVLAIAESYGHSELVLGAWGCGAFGNDPLETALSFRNALEVQFSSSFAEIIFAITDWSPQRKFLGPFREVFK